MSEEMKQSASLEDTQLSSVAGGQMQFKHRNRGKGPKNGGNNPGHGPNKAREKFFSKEKSKIRARIREKFMLREKEKSI